MNTCDIMELRKQYFYRFSKASFDVFLAELEKFKLIIKIDRLKFKVIPTDYDNQIRKYYDKYLWSNGGADG